MYDLAIIGGGPAGVAAGVYASRKQLKTVFITENFDGQSVVSEGIENWIGTIKISGRDLSDNLKKHLMAYAGDIVAIKQGHRVDSIVKNGEQDFTVKVGDATYSAKAVLITTGSSRRKLDAKGADIFEHKGLTYCASCDGPLYAGTDVAVVGGGNAAFESAAQLLAYCKSVTLVNRTDKLRADEVTVAKVLSHPNMRLVNSAIVTEVKGDKFVSALVYTDTTSNKSVELPLAGIFVEIGLIPSTDFLKGIVELSAYNQIVVDPRTQQSKTYGIWAAGDCCDGLYHQNNIAAGDAVRALEDIYVHLKAK
jgi:alkyl hydroperoxide reductase subunit F